MNLQLSWVSYFSWIALSLNRDDDVPLMSASQPLDILVIAPHPDDAEMLCGGLLWKAKLAGKRIGIVDLTRGETGTRGTPQTRAQEAAAASKMLGVDVRENLGLKDGHLIHDRTLLSAIVRVLRKHRPACVLAPHWEDQHPDHAAAGQAILHAAFMAGVPKFEPKSARGVASAQALPYRPKLVLHYNNRYGIHANLIFDISDVFERKMELVSCFQSQFGPGAPKKSGTQSEPQTRLSHANFTEWFRGLHTFYGYQIGARYGEAYAVKSPLRASLTMLDF